MVVPVFNESAALPSLIEELTAVMTSLGRPYELIFVDDASTDTTPTILTDLSTRPGEASIRHIRLARNSGQGAALHRGLRAARGDVIFTLDGDAQNVPADIPRLFQALQDGVDLVCGIRINRQDTGLRRSMSRLANTVRSRVLRDGVRDTGCALKAMRREVVDAMLPLQTLYSFIPALAVAAGFRVGERPVRHRPRRGGRSSYGLRMFLWRPFIDMLWVRWYQSRCAFVRTESAEEALAQTIEASW